MGGAGGRGVGVAGLHPHPVGDDGPRQHVRELGLLVVVAAADVAGLELEHGQDLAVGRAEQLHRDLVAEGHQSMAPASLKVQPSRESLMARVRAGPGRSSQAEKALPQVVALEIESGSGAIGVELGQVVGDRLEPSPSAVPAKIHSVSLAWLRAPGPGWAAMASW